MLLASWTQRSRNLCPSQTQAFPEIFLFYSDTFRTLTKPYSKMEYYSAIKRNETVPFVTTWKDLESVTLNKKRTNTTWLHLYVESKKKKKHKQKSRPINAENWWLPERKWVARWTKWVKGSGRYNLTVMELISHRDERYNTGDTINGTIKAFMVTDGYRPAVSIA